MIKRSVFTRMLWRLYSGCLSRTTGILSFALVMAGVFLVGCSKSTDSQQIKYNIYVGCTQTDQLYVLDAESLTVKDSIPGLGHSLDLVTSEDGRWLYVEANPNPNWNVLTKVSFATKQPVAIIPSLGGTQLAMVRDGKWILRGGPTYEEVIDPVSLALLRIVKDSLPWRDGPRTGSKIAVGFYPWPDEESSLVRILDLATGQLSGNYIPHLQSGESVGAYLATLLPDGRRVVVAGPEHGGCWVLVGDVTTGETLLQFLRDGCHGEIAVSPDGRFAVISDPSSIGNPEAPGPGVDVIDLEHLNHPKRFEPADFGLDSWCQYSQVLFTADGRKVIVAPQPGTAGWVRIIDIGTLSVENVVWPDTGIARIGALGYGPQPR